MGLRGIIPSSSEGIWRGTFSDYYRIVQADSRIARTAHARLAAAIETCGWGPPEESPLGIEDAQVRIRNYLVAAGQGLPLRKRILLLVGPRRSGKRPLFNRLKAALLEYTAQTEGSLYAISGCPIHEEPLHLLPATWRREMHLPFDGDLCSACQRVVAETYNGRVEDVAVEQIRLSTDSGIAIADSDLSEGGIWRRELGRGLGQANRGFLELPHLPRLSPDIQLALLTLSEEHQVKWQREPFTHLDMVLAGRCSLDDYRALAANPKNEALHNRLYVVWVRYPRRIDAEQSLQQRLFARKTFGLQLTPEVSAMTARFAVATRLARVADPWIALERAAQPPPPPPDISVPVDANEDGLSGWAPGVVVDALVGAVHENPGLGDDVGAALTALEQGIARGGWGTEEREHYQALVHCLRAVS